MTDTLKPYTPSLRDRLRYALMGDSHDSTRAHFINGLLKPGGLADFSPAGPFLNAYDAGRAGASGQYVNSLLSGIAAIPALGPLAGKIAGGVKEARAARMAGQDFKTNAFRVADEHANEVTDILSQAHRDANLRSPLPEPASKRMNIEDIIGPRIDQLGTPSKVAPAQADIAKDEIWGKAADQPNMSRRGFLGVGAGAAAASVIGLPHFMKPAAEAIQAAAPAAEAITSPFAAHMAAYEAHAKAAQIHRGILSLVDKTMPGDEQGIKTLMSAQHGAKEASMGANEFSAHDLLKDPYDELATAAQDHAENAESLAHSVLQNEEGADFTPDDISEALAYQPEAFSDYHGDAAAAHDAAAEAHQKAMMQIHLGGKILPDPTNP